MATMTKAQARKRLMEARDKCLRVFKAGITTNAQDAKLINVAQQLKTMAEKLK